MSELLVRDLTFNAHQLIEEYLRPPNPGRDWRTLAEKMGYTNQKIVYLESFTSTDRGPVFHLIKDYESNEKTVSELISLLEEMERRDLIEDLQGHIEESKKRKDRHSCPADKKGPPETLCEEYDVFICYAPPDKPFADEVLRKLEQGPYRFKVCIDYRDFLPGSGCSQLELSAKAIEQKCRKVLVIMSENLNNYAVTDFQAKVALSLSPAAKTRLLIPIKYKPCTVPSWLRHLFYLDYTSEEARLHFWKKLLMSLGYEDSSS
ncbi:myeloid differentiation primary response protein MyD88-like isoform X1 [Acropora muricata]|uniref:myeloid differentiation primary response protein MyD88-like isoform X1 n=1 Tax=Acropora muricata TaxID=159855 RepID=UPI0034E51E81